MSGKDMTLDRCQGKEGGGGGTDLSHLDAAFLATVGKVVVARAHVKVVPTGLGLEDATPNEGSRCVVELVRHASEPGISFDGSIACCSEVDGALLPSLGSSVKQKAVGVLDEVVFIHLSLVERNRIVQIGSFDRHEVVSISSASTLSIVACLAIPSIASIVVCVGAGPLQMDVVAFGDLKDVGHEVILNRGIGLYNVASLTTHIQIDYVFG